MTHPSISKGHYERLEFLGDSVLGLVVADLLLEDFPDSTREGDLTQLRSNLVSRPALAKVARSLNIQAHLQFDVCFQSGKDQISDRVLCAALEALIGAVYRDRGFLAVKTQIKIWFEGLLKEVLSESSWKDPRNELQEVYQARGLAPPQYETSRSGGPDHKPEFQARLQIAWEKFSATAPSKQEAVKQVATKAMKAVTKQPDLILGEIEKQAS